MHRRKIGLPVDLNPTDDHEDPGGRRNEPHAGGHLSGPTVGGEQKLAFARSRCSASDVGEVVRPGVDELKDVVAAARVGYTARSEAL
jgi:hypothetical protein